MKNEPNGDGKNPDENRPTDFNPLPTNISGETSAYELLTRGMSEEEARVLRRVLAEWSRGDENSFPFQLVLITRAHMRMAATVLAEMARILLLQQVAGEEAARRITQSADAKLAEFERVGKLAQLLSSYARELQGYVRDIISRADDGVGHLNKTAANLEQAQTAYLDARQGSEWLAFSAGLLTVATLGFLIGWLACHSLVHAP